MTETQAKSGSTGTSTDAAERRPRGGAPATDARLGRAIGTRRRACHRVHRGRPVMTPRRARTAAATPRPESRRDVTAEPTRHRARRGPTSAAGADPSGVRPASGRPGRPSPSRPPHAGAGRSGPAQPTASAGRPARPATGRPGTRRASAPVDRRCRSASSRRVAERRGRRRRPRQTSGCRRAVGERRPAGGVGAARVSDALRSARATVARRGRPRPAPGPAAPQADRPVVRDEVLVRGLAGALRRRDRRHVGALPGAGRDGRVRQRQQGLRRLVNARPAARPSSGFQITAKGVIGTVGADRRGQRGALHRARHAGRVRLQRLRRPGRRHRADAGREGLSRVRAATVARLRLGVPGLRRRAGAVR